MNLLAGPSRDRPRPPLGCWGHPRRQQHVPAAPDPEQLSECSISGMGDRRGTSPSLWHPGAPPRDEKNHPAAASGAVRSPGAGQGHAPSSSNCCRSWGIRAGTLSSVTHSPSLLEGGRGLLPEIWVTPGSLHLLPLPEASSLASAARGWERAERAGWEGGKRCHSPLCQHSCHGKTPLPGKPSTLPGTQLLEPATLGTASPSMAGQEPLHSLPQDAWKGGGSSGCPTLQRGSLGPQGTTPGQALR